MPKRKADDDVTDESDEEEIDDLESDQQDSESSDFEDLGSSEEEPDESQDDSDGEAFDSVEVDLDFAQPEESDFLGIKTILSNYLDGEKYDSSGLADLVLKNVSRSTLGTVIRCDEDVIGITTVIPLQNKESTAVHQLEQFICKRLKASEEKLKAQEAFQERRAGLLLSERLMNCPPAVAPALQAALLEDLEATQKKKKLRHLIVLARAFREGASGDLVYAQPETECWQPYARWVAEFDCPQRGGAVQKGDKWVRLCMFIPFDKLKRAQQDLEKLLSSESG